MRQKEFYNQFQEYAKLNLKMAEELTDKIVDLAKIITDVYRSGGKVLLMGNGGNGADAEHIAGELVGRVKNNVRPGLPAIAVTTNTSVLTAVGNDFGFEFLFHRQIDAFGKKGDVAIGFSSSGRIDAKSFISGTVSLDRILEGFKMAEDGKLLKIVVLP